MEIPKYNLDKFLKENKGYKVEKRLKDTTIILLPSGEILKILDKELLEEIDNTGYDLNTRLGEVKNLSSFKRFALPTRKLEQNGIINSYTMDYIPGVDFTDYYENIYDLKSYADIHSQMENNIKDGNKVGITFPDLCTTENIRVTPDGKVYFLDFDGLQIKKMRAVGFSDFMGNRNDVCTPKYYNFENGLFTPEIDIKSAIFLYFVDVFGVNLAAVNHIDGHTGDLITLDTVFSLINLQDASIQQKVWKLYQEHIPNEFLGDDLYRLAENHTLMPSPDCEGLKMLVKR